MHSARPTQSRPSKRRHPTGTIQGTRRRARRRRNGRSTWPDRRRRHRTTAARSGRRICCDAHAAPATRARSARCSTGGLACSHSHTAGRCCALSPAPTRAAARSPRQRQPPVAARSAQPARAKDRRIAARPYAGGPLVHRPASSPRSDRARVPRLFRVGPGGLAVQGGKEPILGHAHPGKWRRTERLFRQVGCTFSRRALTRPSTAAVGGGGHADAPAGWPGRRCVVQAVWRPAPVTVSTTSCKHRCRPEPRSRY